MVCTIVLFLLSGCKIEMSVKEYYTQDKDFDADIVIFRLGENVQEEDAPYFKEAIEKFIRFICPKRGKTIFTTCFWARDTVDNPIREVAKARGETCVELGVLSKDETNMALGQFEHFGVSIHPSDKGMEEIAEVIYCAIEKNRSFKGKKI